ncbi:MAG TPA: hypothetical protein VLZ77_14525 [Acidimicrobiales bacterium]|nr:hypothetical protein [Acidimicrobiales bacterium]
MLAGLRSGQRGVGGVLQIAVHLRHLHGLGEALGEHDDDQVPDGVDEPRGAQLPAPAGGARAGPAVGLGSLVRAQLGAVIGVFARAFFVGSIVGGGAVAATTVAPADVA